MSTMSTPMPMITRPACHAIAGGAGGWAALAKPGVR
jgi:hypothetical protein